jgi:hypothetical protein
MMRADETEQRCMMDQEWKPAVKKQLSETGSLQGMVKTFLPRAIIRHKSAPCPTRCSGSLEKDP